MPMPQTRVVTQTWVADQEPKRWLTEMELTTLAAWPSETRRREWLAGRLAAKRLLHEDFGLTPLACEIGRTGVAPCVIGPNAPAVALSLSHCHGLGAASWSNTLTEGTVGIDAQYVRPVHPGLWNRVYTSAEQAQITTWFGTAEDTSGMLLFWAAKEAAIKARRAPWGRSLQEINVTLTGGASAVISVAGEPLMTAEYLRFDSWWLVRAISQS